MKPTRTLSLALLGALLATSLFAAGGETAPPAPPAASLTPEQIAVKEYNAGIELRAKALEAAAKAAEVEGKKHDKLMAKREEMFEKAAKRFRVAIENKPDFAQAHGSLGYALRQLGQYEEAMEAYDTALGINPNYPNAIEYRAEALLGLGRIAEAQEAYQKLSMMSSEHATQLLDAIKAWAAEADHDQAAAVAEWAADRSSLANDTGAEGGPQSWR